MDSGIQVVRYRAISINELRPGHATRQNVRRDAARQRPSLEMLATKSHVQARRIPGRREPVAELYVFDRRASEPFVETSQRSEHVGANRSESPPERRCPCAPHFVDVCMRQI